MDKYESLKLKNQICFPLYASSKEIVSAYRPFLDEIDLTYTQYITMMVIWEYKALTVKEIGSYLFLDSGTLTPVLKKLEAKEYISRSRDLNDERIVNVHVTEKGMELRDKALSVPQAISKCVKLEENEALALYKILHKLLSGFEKEKHDI